MPETFWQFAWPAKRYDSPDFSAETYDLWPNTSPEPTAAALFIDGFWSFGIHKFFAPWLSFFVRPQDARKIYEDTKQKSNRLGG